MCARRTNAGARIVNNASQHWYWHWYATVPNDSYVHCASRAPSKRLFLCVPLRAYVPIVLPLTMPRTDATPEHTRNFTALSTSMLRLMDKHAGHRCGIIIAHGCASSRSAAGPSTVLVFVASATGPG